MIMSNKTKKEYDSHHAYDNELIEPFKTLNKGFYWLFDLIKLSSIWPGAIASTIPFTYRLMMNILKARKSIVKGLVENTILEILGGLRSACTYAGSKKLKDFPKCTTFIRVSKQHNDMWN